MEYHSKTLHNYLVYGLDIESAQAQSKYPRVIVEDK